MEVRASDRRSGSGSGQPITAVDQEAVREQVERIVAHPLFSNSKRFGSLLRFIADRSLDGRTEDLKERIIGIEVFGRSPDYDTSNDAAVRVAATGVRKRLALYYKEPQHEQELRIDLPAGSYVVQFRPSGETLDPLTSEKTPAKLLEHKRWYLGSIVAIVVLALATWGLRREVSSGPDIDRFWSPVLSGPGPVVLYLGALAGVAPSPDPPSPLPASSENGERLREFLQQRGQPVAYTSAVSALSSFLQRKGREFLVRPANSASLSDLRSAPGILLGSYNNEWVVRLGGDLHFRLRRESETGRRWIEDSSNPQNRNWGVDLSAPYGQIGEDYVLITRVLDQSVGRWLISIAGLTRLGTAAGSDFVLDPNAVKLLGARLPKDWARKNLQVVLAVKVVQGSPGASQVVAVHTW